MTVEEDIAAAESDASDAGAAMAQAWAAFKAVDRTGVRYDVWQAFATKFIAGAASEGVSYDDLARLVRGA